MSTSVRPAAPESARLTKRHTTVLFAEARGADAARYVEVLGQAAELSGGRVLNTRHNGVLALFATANAAAAAAARMHTYAQTLLPLPERTALRIGFHAGPVGQRDHDIFGDTVNLALRVADQAKDGQVLVTHDTASSLSPALQNLVRPSGHVTASGSVDSILIGELAWRDALPQITATRDVDAEPRTVLEVRHGASSVVRRRQGDSVLIGRDEQCDVVVEAAHASRRHCTIVKRGGSLILCDTSSNGTFVTPQGGSEIHVRSGEISVAMSGCISVGQPTASSAALVRYRCA
jgi:adenylate cyclase